MIRRNLAAAALSRYLTGRCVCDGRAYLLRQLGRVRIRHGPLAECGFLLACRAPHAQKRPCVDLPASQSPPTHHPPLRCRRPTLAPAQAATGSWRILAGRACPPSALQVRGACWACWGRRHHSTTSGQHYVAHLLFRQSNTAKHSGGLPGAH